MPRSQPLEHVSAERRRRGDRDPHYLIRTGCGRRIASASRRASGGRPVEDQDPVEVVELVLGDARRQPLELEPHVLARHALRLDRHALVPLDGDHDALERETALLVGHPLVGVARPDAG